jgi:hypothetical protein
MDLYRRAVVQGLWDASDFFIFGFCCYLLARAVGEFSNGQATIFAICGGGLAFWANRSRKSR